MYDENRILTIKIIDEGIGIKNIDKAMQPLYTSKPQMERSGMGFSFMQAFMDSLVVESECGRGTTVTMTKSCDGKSAMIENRAGNDTDRLVEENIGLIYMVLKRFKNRGRDMEELFQVGAEGLTKAAARFEPDRGYAFSTYAVPMIIGEIQRFIRDDGMVHISRKIKEDARKIAVIREQLEKD